MITKICKLSKLCPKTMIKIANHNLIYNHDDHKWQTFWLLPLEWDHDPESSSN